MTIVWPALWPPWKSTTTSARSVSQSTILPLPSSPHWAPTTVTLAMAELFLQGLEGAAGPDMGAAERGGVVGVGQGGDGGVSGRVDGLRDLGFGAERQEDAVAA